MPNLVEIVGKLAEVFDRLELRFAVGGALANNFWGVIRTTFDIDCLVAIPTLKYQLLADALDVIGCTLRDKNDRAVPISVPGLREQALKYSIITCFHDSVRIELFVPAVPLQDEVLRRAVMLPLNGLKVPITTAEDLILLKLAFHRPKDLDDVRGILWVQRGRLDLAYLRHWSAESHEHETQVELDRLIAEYAQMNDDGPDTPR
jgi:hypothetical protein